MKPPSKLLRAHFIASKIIGYLSIKTIFQSMVQFVLPFIITAQFYLFEHYFYKQKMYFYKYILTHTNILYYQTC